MVLRRLATLGKCTYIKVEGGRRAPRKIPKDFPRFLFLKKAGKREAGVLARAGEGRPTEPGTFYKGLESGKELVTGNSEEKARLLKK